MIDKPHDKLFKGYMGEVDHAIDFAKHYFPEEILEIIDTQTIRPEKDSFITGKMKEYYSDLLFSVDILGKSGKIYILFEHKSYIDDKVGFQLLKAMVMIWDKIMTPKKESEQEVPKHLPVIIPLVFYQGERAWTLAPKFQIMYQEYDQLPLVLQKLLPDFQYLLYDFSEEKEEKILGSISFQIYIRALQMYYEKDLKKILDRFRHIMELFAKMEDYERERKWVEMLFEYMLHMPDAIEVKELQKMTESIGKERGGLMPTIAEKLRKEGLQEGLQEGRQEGLEEGRKELAKVIWTFIINKFKDIPDTYEQKIKSLSNTHLKMISEALFSMDRWEKLDEYIPE